MWVAHIPNWDMLRKAFGGIGEQMQLSLGAGAAEASDLRNVQPFKTQLLKWIGNKQRFAHQIISYFPDGIATYYEPFVGSGAVLGTLAPPRAVASDVLRPLIEIWQTLRADPCELKRWYASRYERVMSDGDKRHGFELVKADYNASPNGADLLFVSRSCYGGVVRFRTDGYLSTPCGAHTPVTPASFARRVDVWHERTSGADFRHLDFEEAMADATTDDLVYCDPPYSCTQSILYGAQSFALTRLLDAIASCKDRGVRVVLSIDGTKRSGELLCNVPIPDGLFEREAVVNCGRSMLRRFQKAGESLEDEVVRDRLLLTY